MPLLPTHYRTVGGMIAAQVSIIASCRKCQNGFKVSLEAIACLQGDDYSLVGQHPVCRIWDCDGRCHFLVSDSDGTPRFTLDRWSKADLKI